MISRKSNSNEHAIARTLRMSSASFVLFFYLTAATQTPRTRTDRPHSRDRQTDLPTAEDPRRPRSPAANPCRFPRRKGTSGSLCSGSVSRTAMLTRHLNFARYEVEFFFLFYFSFSTLFLHLILFGLFSIFATQQFSNVCYFF